MTSCFIELNLTKNKYSGKFQIETTFSQNKVQFATSAINISTLVLNEFSQATRVYHHFNDDGFEIL